jgi:hypothetical protein
MSYTPANRHLRSLGARLTASLAAAGLIATASGALAAPAGAKTSHHHHVPPIQVTVFSPGAGDHSGTAGSGFVVDLALDATKPAYNSLLSSAAGYKPFFNAPPATTFGAGLPDPGAPGLVVLLSSTPTMAGTTLQGPNTNLAGLFQINGVATVGGKAEAWNTWLVGKAAFGTGPSTLTAYVVSGTAPAVVPAGGIKKISNVVRVPFVIHP